MVPLAPLAYNDNNIAFMTPPVVSAGAVAYGVIVGAHFTGTRHLASGGPAGGLTIKQPEPRVVTFTFRNVEVLAALQKMTGQDFGYDIDVVAALGQLTISIPPPSRPAALLSRDVRRAASRRLGDHAPALARLRFTARSRPWRMSRTTNGNGSPWSGRFASSSNRWLERGWIASRRAAVRASRIECPARSARMASLRRSELGPSPTGK